ncbi:MAG: hypothetical protein H6835_02715 [Planctomycetes bacterium]|nr:hypothetical protein [Planctomycetota bacterium]
MPASPDELLADVLAAPDDDAPRRALAAAWRAAGDARGELIDVQLALAGLPAWHPDEPALRRRERAMLATHGAAWRGAVPTGALDVRFVRGLVGHASGSPRALAEHLPALCAAAPATSVAIDFEDDGVNDDDLEALCACEAFGGVRSLSVPEGDCAPAAWRRLCAAPVWRRLRSMSLGPGMSQAAVVTAMAAGAAPATLAVLEFEGFTEGIGDAGARALAAASWASQLRELQLRGQALGDDALAALAAASLALTRLDVANVGYRDNAFSAPAIEALSASRWFAGLTACNLVGCAIGGAAAVALTRAPLLDRAWLSRTGLGAGELRVLLGAACWPRLVELSLAGNPLGDDGARLLAGAARLPAVLALAGCGIGPDGLDALAGGAAVDALDVRGNPLAAEHWQRALDADRLPRATALMLDANGFPAELCAALRQRYPRCDLIGQPAGS